MAWEAVSGLGSHAQLATRSNICSGPPTAPGAAPNTFSRSTARSAAALRTGPGSRASITSRLPQTPVSSRCKR